MQRAKLALVLGGFSLSDRLRALAASIQRPFRRMRPPQIVVLVFLALVLTGSAILCLPVCAKSGEPTKFLTALFTATSATCVTGLIPVDTGTYWSTFGQVVIIVLIQLGGLGFMTVSTIFFLALRRRIGLRQRMVLAQGLGVSSMSGVVRYVRNVILGTFCVEGAGALILFFRFLPEFGAGTALWYGVFHSISAFCNAGFDILADVSYGGSVARYVMDPVVNLTLMALIVIGSLGFSVWGEIRHTRRFSRLSVYARLVILITLGLIFGGGALFALLEWNNPGTIGNLTPGGKILASLFQSITLRTAGFASFNQDALTEASKVLSDLLMFVGGSSGSTAGGVKTVTMGLVVLSAVSTMRGRRQVTVFGRSISQEDISNAVSVALLVMGLSLLGAAVITVCDGCSFMNAIYETISALCTVGLTTGITPTLCTASKLILIVFMFFGRVGIMTIGVGFMMGDRAKERVQYAQTKVMIG